jgi:hypothetical protein
MITRLLVASTCELIVLANIGCADAKYESDARAYVERVLTSVLVPWNAQELLDNSDPRLLEVTPPDEVRKLVDEYKRHLGAVKGWRVTYASAGMTLGTLFSGRQGVFVVQLYCDLGTADLQVNVRRVRSGWRILRFWIRVPEHRSSVSVR